MQQPVILVNKLEAWPWYVQYELWLGTTHAAFTHCCSDRSSRQPSLSWSRGSVCVFLLLCSVWIVFVLMYPALHTPTHTHTQVFFSCHTGRFFQIYSHLVIAPIASLHSFSQLFSEALCTSNLCSPARGLSQRHGPRATAKLITLNLDFTTLSYSHLLLSPPLFGWGMCAVMAVVEPHSLCSGPWGQLGNIRRMNGGGSWRQS